MKKIFLILVTFGLFLAGCEDKLDMNPHQSLSEAQTFSKAQDFENAVRGVYTEMLDAGAKGEFRVIFPDVASDNLIQCRDGRLTLSDVQDWNLSSDHYYPGNFWAAQYDAINIANKVIANAKDFEAVDEAGRQLIENAVGEAYALKAILHFDLVRIFGESYEKATDQSPGIPYMEEARIGFPERETVRSNYDNIVADLKTAIDKLTLENGKARINKSTAQAYLAKVYFFMGDYDNAITYANKALPNYGLNTIDAFPSIWTDETDKGVIFKLAITEQDGVEWANGFSQTSPDGTKSEYVCDYELYQMYDANDVRLNTYITTSEFNGTNYNHIKKFMGRPGANATPNLVDIKALRTAELLLTRAESYYMTSQEGKALDDLNALRSHRYTGFTPGTETGQALIDEIRKQRRLELAFEGDRWFDLKRRNVAITRASYGDHADGTGDVYRVLTLDKDDPQWLYPIPDYEMNANPKMKQNDGY